MRIGILSAQLGEEDVHENRRLIREALLLGHKAVIINYRKAVVVMAGRKQVLYQPDKKGVLMPVRIDAVIPRINEADSKSITLATTALETLIAGGAYTTAGPGAIRLSKDKVRSLLAITAAGIPSPRTAAITTTDVVDLDLDKVLKTVEPNINRRLIVKTISGTHGKGVMSANSRAEARAIVEGFLVNRIPIMLQQFVEPTKKDQYIDLRFIVIGGKCISAMKREAVRKDEIRANISLGGMGLSHKPSEWETELAERAARAVGLSVAGVDIIPSGKKRLVIEVNSSPGFVIEKINRVNIARQIVQQATSHARAEEGLQPNKLKEVLNKPVPIPDTIKFKNVRPKISKALSPEAIRLIRIKVKSISE
jgi:ribosomal protein S6--L-glutamate ligase